jgi:hypothetical protein
MDLTENIDTTFKTYVDKAICLSIVKEKHNGLDFLYVKTLNSLDENIRKQFKKPAKEALKKLVAAKFEISLQTPEGQDSYWFYKNEKVRENLVKNGSLEEVKNYLITIANSEKQFNNLVDGFIATGNIPVLKMLIEHPINETQTIELDHSYCLYAIEANQKNLFNYFRLTIDEVVKDPSSFLMTFASRAIDNGFHDLLKHIMSLGDTDVNKLLMWSMMESDISIQSYLVDKGASIEYVKNLSVYYEEKASDLYAYRLIHFAK